MKKALTTLAFSLMVASVSVQAGPQNPSYENGLTGWTTNDPSRVNAVTSHTASDGIGNSVMMLPTHGNYFALIEAGEYATSLTSSGFTVGLGEKVSFDWFFDAVDYSPFNDFGSYALSVFVSGVPIVANILADVAAVGNFGLTGWNKYSFMSPLAGKMSLSFYSHNWDDFLLSSYVGVDNIIIGDKKIPEVSEPAMLILFAAGLLGLGYITTRRNNELLAS